MVEMCNWAYHESIGCGGLAGGSSGERQWRDRGGAAALTRNPAWGGAMWGNTWLWELC
jgi:hypothetical protein